MRIGNITIGSIGDWELSSGPVTSWHPTAASLEAARQAPVSSVPATYMQTQHLRGYYERTAAGLDYSRLLVATCEIPGQCDIDVMSFALNAYLRRHDTYRSWFEYNGTGDIVRHIIDDPADIEFAPTMHGEMTIEELYEHAVATPDPLQWGCFSFGIIQADDHFTFYASIDHVHGDASLIGITMLESYAMYMSLAAGNGPLALPDAGSYHDYCLQERQDTSAMTADSPDVRAWIDFAENNNGSLPEFPLPLGNPMEATDSAMITETLLDAEQTERFESACTAAGARFIGGVFACSALVEHEFTGAVTYYGLTPRDTRRTSENFMTQGWFTGLVPITVPIAAASFSEAAWAAQTSFDSDLSLAKVPYYRVLELAPWLDWPPPNFPVTNFLHGGAAPLNAVLTAEVGGAKNIGIYSDGRYSYQLTIYIFRYGEGTIMAVMHPDNPIAQKSVTRYVEAMKSAFTRVADRGNW
ncbi:condensation domain-containing protein [Mycobacterium colombiense]|uniref:condensation domain-containing protein n=1 Tax=Mycobacterium colombiense TaxID=339268 RepID=UPI00096FC721|nr:condensation domain-containing protein [Mycobacterium colombiense]OMC30102.1 acyltransferase [Mycobacterium colombiense]